ncbi:tautomerase family protein [Lysobacter arenosi]|jgi:4-oxalocrotonate tautomerase|uniref:Tautomerase family protein n=1 Tax=Lysobacter arenosi TaxID=2795387 RepID=A0ABX7RE51_9GAMM|nr:tautomerase family protein [Lysobacter arenosi]QSX75254.1 tautomerase family protein [Lysobacter arenosi]
MPLVRVDLMEGKDDAWLQGIGDVIHAAIEDVLKAPKDDRFQVFTRHPRGELSIDRTYMGIERSDDCILIQVTISQGRSVETKQAFYRAVADGLHARLGMRTQDVFINLVEVVKENWSFGDGIAQYA